MSLKLNELPKSHQDRLTQGAQRYAAGDRSDPFAMARTMTHLKNGVGLVQGKNGEIEMFDATPTKVTRRIPDAVAKELGSEAEYKVTEFIDMKRP